jgi:hypothetical protein
MEDILKNKMFIIVAVFMMFNVMIFVGGKYIVNKAADEVIERLERNYSPSPYGPGLDPDKVDPSILDNARVYMELRQTDGVNPDPLPAAFIEQEAEIAYAAEWREQWEKDRGFNQ